jgi:hypothetical protein
VEVGGNGVRCGPRVAWARGAFVAGVELLLLVSWWPFRVYVPRLVVESGVETRSDGSLRFVDEAFASTSGPPDWLATALDNGSLEVALLVRSDDADQTGPARILALSAVPQGAGRDLAEQDLVIGQEGPDSNARVVRPDTAEQVSPPLIAAGVFRRACVAGDRARFQRRGHPHGRLGVIVASRREVTHAPINTRPVPSSASGCTASPRAITPSTIATTGTK